MERGKEVVGYRLTEKGEKWLWSVGPDKGKDRLKFELLEALSEGESLLEYLRDAIEARSESGGGYKGLDTFLKEVERLEREGYIESDDSAVADVYLKETGREL